MAKVKPTARNAALWRRIKFAQGKCRKLAREARRGQASRPSTSTIASDAFWKGREDAYKHCVELTNFILELHPNERIGYDTDWDDLTRQLKAEGALKGASTRRKRKKK